MYKTKKISVLMVILLLTLLLSSVVGAESEPLQLTDDEIIEMYNSPFPDGSKILYSGQLDELHWNLYTIPVDGSKEKTNISPGEGTYHYPDIDPTGNYICYSTGTDDNGKWEIAILEVDGEETILTNNESAGFDSHFPVFNGDTTKIAYVKRNWDTMIDSIIVMDVDGTNEQEICSLYSGIPEMIYDIDWLGNEDELVFTTNSYTLYRVSVKPGSSPIRIGYSKEYHTCYSNADGNRILCAEGYHDDEGEYHERYITINPDGSEKVIIVDLETFPEFDGLYCQLCWLPDESALVNLATLPSTPEQFDLFMIDKESLIYKKVE